MHENPRILICDDEVGVLTTTAQLLEDKGFNCSKAVSAQDAMQVLESQEISLVIADIVMPGNHDLQLIKDISTQFRGLPVIIITGYPTVETAVRALDLPVFAYLTKPLDIEFLFEKTAEAIKWRLAYRSIALAEQRLADSITRVGHMTGLSVPTKGRMAESNLQMFLSLTYSNALAAVTDLGALSRAVLSPGSIALDCPVTHCPKLEILTSALKRTVEVLKATKDNFKSKEIAALRKDIEELLSRGTTGQTL